MTPLEAYAVALAREAADRVPHEKVERAVKPRAEVDPGACIVCGIEPHAPEDDTCGALTCREIWLEEAFGRR